LAAVSNPRVLVLGIGSGRNVPALVAAGGRVDAIEDDPERARAALVRHAASGAVRVARSRYAGPYPFAGTYAGALSTHALLHGIPADVAAALASVRDRLAAGAPFFFTLGSKRDPRFGAGRSAGPDTYASETGSEAGVAHCYFDEPGVRALLAGLTLEALEERDAATSAGTWAHEPHEAATLVHWFVRTRRAERPAPTQ
jgi:SAM-dependent methyltransferase